MVMPELTSRSPVNGRAVREQELWPLRLAGQRPRMCAEESACGLGVPDTTAPPPPPPLPLVLTTLSILGRNMAKAN